MIIKIEGPPENLQAAWRSLEVMAHDWGHEITAASAEPATAARNIPGHDGKAIDPTSVAALVLSIPSTALAVLDLTDRMRKRRRAKEMIEQAQQLAAQRVTIRLTTEVRTVEVGTLDPDQLLDMLADQDPAS